MEISKLGYGAASSLGNVSGAASSALNRPLQRLDRETESTRVRLSSFGQLKSAAAQTESSARALQDSSKLATVDDVKKTLQNFVSAVNGEQNAIRQLSGSAKSANSQAATGALAGDARVRVAGNELRRAVVGNNGTNEPDLRKMGLSVAQDGTVKLDTKQLEKAFQENPGQVKETLNRIGQEVADVSSKQLSNNGFVGGSVNRLSSRLNSLEQNQANYQAQLETAQDQMAQRNNRLQQTEIDTQQAFGFNGVSAYRGVFSI